MWTWTNCHGRNKDRLYQGCSRAVGQFSQAIVHNGLAYLAGQIPVVPGHPDARLEGIEAQTLQVLKNIDAVLKASGSSREGVLKATLYVTDIRLWCQVNAVYADYFGAHKPTRTVVPVAVLRYGYLIEMDVIAAVS
jgi:2-iminobutanoate/2-iminopropanoate deaminase